MLLFEESSWIPDVEVEKYLKNSWEETAESLTIILLNKWTYCLSTLHILNKSMSNVEAKYGQ